jgi:hypothetical protein
MLLPGLVAGLLTGLLVAAPLNRQASAPNVAQPVTKPFDIASLSPAELETLAFNALEALRDKRGLAEDRGLINLTDSWDTPSADLRQARLGIKNARRLLPLAKNLTLEALRASLKSSGLVREKQSIASVKKIVLDPGLGDTAEVREDNLSVIHIGTEYATYLTSDDEVMLLLGHELTHVAARTGRLNQFIEEVAETARLDASIAPVERQKEELACDFVGAEVLKRFIALHPTEETNAERFTRAFGYDPPAERFARAWQYFCDYYKGDLGDEEHLSPYQTLNTLLRFDTELKALVPDDTMSIRLCR